MKTTLSMIFLLIWTLFACKVEPRDIAYGSDMCHHCKMTLMDTKFGAEVLTKKGKIFIFDDVNCLMDFMDSDQIDIETEVEKVLVTDYSNPEKLIDATLAFYLKSEAFKTPMASQIVAFEDYEVLKKFKAEQGGVYLAWGELITQFK